MFDKTKFSNILSKIKNNEFHSITEFAQKSDVNRTYLSQYINELLNSPPSPKILRKIANASNGITTYQELMEVCGHVEKEFTLMDGFSSKVYNKIEEKKEATSLEEKAQRMLDYMEKHDLDSLAMLPIYGRIPAGEPKLAEQYIEGVIPIDPRLMGKNTNGYFYLKVIGNSMNKKFQDGDYVLIKEQSTLENGEIGVILVNGDDATIKKFRRISNEMVLLEPMSDDPKYEPIVIDLKKTSIKILGKAVNYFGSVN